MTTETDNPKPRRRWLQYSLRTFFVLLTVFCVWLGWTVHRANEQRKAVAWVREMGWSVEYDDAEPPSPKWLVELLGVDYFQEVSFVVVLSGGRSTAEIKRDRELSNAGWGYDFSPAAASEEERDQIRKALPNCKIRVVWPLTPELPPIFQIP